MHRDIKPDNLLFGGNDLKISDFGLGKILSSESYDQLRSHTICGSPAYMSPQIIEKWHR